MSDLNQCQFIGRLGDNPQIKQMQNGEPMATFSIAVSEKWNDQNGQRQEKTEWVKITAFGKLAQIMGQYLIKGSQVFIQGKLVTTKYTDQNGIERWSTSIKADKMQMLGGGQQQQNQPQQYQQTPTQQPYQPQAGYGSHRGGNAQVTAMAGQAYQQMQQPMQPPQASMVDENIPF